MPEEDDVTAGDSGESSTPAPATKKSPDPVPYARFQEVVQQRRALEAKLAEAETARTNAETEKHAAIAKLTEQEVAAVKAAQDAQVQFAGDVAVLGKYKEVVSSTVNDMTTDWPEEAKMFDPGADADPLVRLEWANKAKLLVAKLQPILAGPGSAPKPTPKSTTPTTQEVKNSVDVKRRF
jgi:multidrug efflux pump subunit AcrA (membrane-fusion protein)